MNGNDKQTERLTWIEERLEGIEGHLLSIDKTLENHMREYTNRFKAQQTAFESLKELMKVRVDSINWKFNVAVALLVVIIGGVIGGLVTGFFKFAGG